MEICNKQPVSPREQPGLEVDSEAELAKSTRPLQFFVSKFAGNGYWQRSVGEQKVLHDGKDENRGQRAPPGLEASRVEGTRYCARRYGRCYAYNRTDCGEQNLMRLSRA